ncbi:CHASE domain-containing protein [Imhoffiella purpurea]|nr:CHASE domain-containing protein [Imhoffiella purpurea]
MSAHLVVMNPLFRTLILPLLVSLVGVLAAGLIETRLVERQRAEAVARFAVKADQVVEYLAERIGSYEHGLRGMRGVIVSLWPDRLTRAKVIAYSRTRELEREFPGSRGFGFIRRVPRAEEAAFLERARRDGKPDFSIRTLTPHDDERLVIQYIEPEANNRQAVGLDIGSERNRRDAAFKAMRTGRATLTHPITLVQASGKVNRGFLLMIATYPAAEPSTPEAREEAAYGLAYTPLVIDEILAGYEARSGELSLALYDLDDSGRLDRFYASRDADSDATDLIEHRQLHLFGREWLAEIRALPPFLRQLNQTSPRQVAFEIAASGLLLAALLYGYLVARARTRETQRVQARLAAIVSDASEAIVGENLEGMVTDWNPAAETIFGYSEQEAMGRAAIDLIVPAGLETEERHLNESVLSGTPVSQLMTRRHRADGGDLDVSITASQIRDADGRVVGIAKTIRDVSVQIAAERRIRALNAELERKVEERTAHLETALHELADFSYLASHDLRTPLRAIDGFSSLLLRESDTLNEAHGEYLQRVRAAAQHMGRIIDDMVALAQVSRSGFSPETLDISGLADKVVAALRAAYPDDRVEVRIQAGLQVRADAKLAHILLMQLFDNAWKFTRAIPNPVVEFAEEGRELFVRDNGVGFEMAYAKRLFAPFHRLHTSDEYPGSGIGLAIVQRIVNMHGGHVRAEGAVGRGATIWFRFSPDDRSEDPG